MKIVEIPISQIERLENRCPQNIEEWLEIQGFKKEDFSDRILNAISRGIDSTNNKRKHYNE